MPLLVLEFTRSSVRLLALRGRPPSPRLRQIFLEPVPQGQELDESVRRLLARVQGRRAQVLCAIPRNQVLTRLMQLPATQAEEVRQMVELTGRTQFPDPSEKIVIDSALVDQHAAGSTVQVVACRRELLERYLRLAQQANLELLGVTPNSWGLLWWYRDWAKDQAGRDPVMLVHVDTDHTDLLVLRQGRMLFSRSLAQGRADWQAEAPGTLEPLVQELERSLTTFRKDWPGVEVQGFVVTGVGPSAAIARALEQRWGKPVAVADLKPAISRVQGAEQFDGSPAALLGLARADRQQLVNLLPPEARQAQAYGRRMRQFSVTGALLLLTFMMGLSLLLVSIHRRERAAGQAVTSLRGLQAATEHLTQQARFIQLVETTLASRRRTASMLAELFQLTPSTITYESVTFERVRGELIIRGVAPTTRHVLDYVRALEQSPQWTRVDLRYSRRHGGSAGSSIDFEMILQRRS